ncbi:unnamed protein product [Brugia timori]|uniref:DUF295 domain-containing protein n=1 Tax=Brugia timori TaxID=42155 RepID=A0A0R3RBG7_9BILA|nr:unnamed protein product [Brugia timori]
MRLNDPNKRLQGDVFSLTGYTDSSVSMFSSSIVHPFHDCLLFDESFIPARCPCPVDHRGRKVYLNAYAIDFWRLESKKTLERDNGISENRVWSLIHNFSVCYFQHFFIRYENYVTAEFYLLLKAQYIYYIYVIMQRR